MSEILELFIAIKYPPKKYKWIVILGDGVNKSKVHGIGSITVEIQKKIELHDVLYFLDITNALYFIIDHGRQPDCSFVINNGSTTVRFPTFTLLAKNNK